MVNLLENLVPPKSITIVNNPSLGRSYPISLSIGRIIKLNIKNKKNKYLEFNINNFISNRLNVNNNLLDEMSRNYFIYVLDKHNLHTIELSSSTSTFFSLEQIHSDDIYVLSYYFGTYPNTEFSAEPNFQGSYNDLKPTITLSLKKNNTYINKIHYDKVSELVNNFPHYNMHKEKTEELIEKIKHIYYYDVDSDGILTINNSITNYGQRLSNLFNLCLALEIKTNQVLKDELMNCEYVNDDFKNDTEENDFNTNILFMTSNIINKRGVYLLNDLITLIGPTYKYRMRFESKYLYITGKFTTDDIIESVLKRIDNDRDPSLVAYYKFKLRIKSLDNLSSKLDYIFNRINYSKSSEDIIFEISKHLLDPTNLNTILTAIQNIFKYSWLHGTTFKINNKHAKKLLKTLKKYNNGNLQYMTFKVNSNKVKDLIYKYNKRSFKNVKIVEN